MPTARKPEPVKHRRAAKRIRRFDSDGLDLPTELEVEEGAAYRKYQEKPQDEQRYTEWVLLAFRLQHEEGLPCTSRCSACGTQLWGRTKAQGCGHCGHKEP